MSSIEQQEVGTGENIINAVQVLMSTYANIRNLADALDEIARGYTAFKPLSANVYLTWISPREVHGWLYRFVIKAYKKEKEDNILYTVEISLDEHNHGIPAIIMGKHYYSGNPPERINTYPSVAMLTQRHHWQERYLINPDGRNIDFGIAFTSTLRSGSIDAGGHDKFERAVFKKIRLIGITKADIKPKIFDVLESL